jgi:hypothetical protein
MVLGLTTGQLGAILTAASLVLLWLRIFRRARAVMVFAGICLLGTGWLLRVLLAMARVLSGVTGALFARIFGAAVPGVLGLFVLGLLVYDLHPRGGGAAKRTYWLAVLAAVILVAGLAGYQALNSIPAGVHTGLTTVTGG